MTDPQGPLDQIEGIGAMSRIISISVPEGELWLINRRTGEIDFRITGLEVADDATEPDNS